MRFDLKRHIHERDKKVRIVDQVQQLKMLERAVHLGTGLGAEQRIQEIIAAFDRTLQNGLRITAKEIAHVLNKKVETECLLKTKDITEQSKLNKEDRIKNIHGVYELINKEKLFDKKILLIDDIYTTGSTVSECAKELKKAKPREIGVFTLAKD